MDNDKPTFSIVIPVFNENQSLADLLTSIERVMTPLGERYEILFVDDGSTDGTLDTLKGLAAGHPTVRVLSFRRNLGKSPALSCGLQRATGRYVMTLDADLQDEPGDLPLLYNHMLEHRVDVVSGWRRERHDSLLKRVSSRLFNLVIVRTLFGVTFRDMGSGLKLYTAEVAKGLRLYGGMHRFIPLIAHEMGFRVAEVAVRHHARRHGQSKYRATKVLTEFPDLLTVFFLTKYTRRPLHFFGKVGSLLFVAGFLVLAYLSVLWLQGTGIGTRPLLTLGVLLVLVGGQVVFTGLLADLIVNMNQDREQEFHLKYASDQSPAREEDVQPW